MKKIAITYGKKKEVVAYFVREKPQKAKRNLGILEGKVHINFMPDFKITTDEFLGL